MKDEKKFPSSVNEEDFFEDEEEKEEDLSEDEDFEDEEREEDMSEDDESEDEIMEEDERKNDEDTRKIFRVLKEECLECGYLVPWIENLFPCTDDPDCPSRKFSFVSGRDPQKIAIRLANLTAKRDRLKKDKKSKTAVRNFLKVIANRSDAFQIYAIAAEEMKRIQIEEQRKQAEGEENE